MRVLEKKVKEDSERRYRQGCLVKEEKKKTMKRMFLKTRKRRRRGGGGSEGEKLPVKKRGHT